MARGPDLALIPCSFQEPRHVHHALPPAARPARRPRRAPRFRGPLRPRHPGRAAVSAWRDMERTRRQFRAVLRPRHQGRALPVRRRRQDRAGAHRAARIHRRGFPCVRAGPGAGRRVRLPRARALRARARPPLQSQQAAARPLCKGPCRRTRLGARNLRLHARLARRRPVVRRARQRAVRAEMQGGRFDVLLDPSGPPRRGAGSRHRLRSACARLHENASGPARAAARHLRRLCPPTRDRLHPRARRDDGRTAAGAYLRQRQLPARQGPDELLGLQHDRLLCRRSALFRGQEGVLGRIQGDGGPLPPGRARSDPRRRVQPHGRRQRARPHAVVQGYRQRLLLPADARPASLLHQRHRHREHLQPVVPARAGRWSPTACATGWRR